MVFLAYRPPGMLATLVGVALRHPGSRLLDPSLRSGAGAELCRSGP